jgi:hypothetical protein
MLAAAAAILEGMPEPRDLRLHQVTGRCVVTAGHRQETWPQTRTRMTAGLEK